MYHPTRPVRVFLCFGSDNGSDFSVRVRFGFRVPDFLPRPIFTYTRNLDVILLSSISLAIGFVYLVENTDHQDLSETFSLHVLTMRCFQFV